MQLAVVAHIRHTYTNYDRLLRVTSFQEARAAVEDPTLEKLVAWRGDDENGKTVLEDVFREVIVISDSEDEDEESDTAPNETIERDVSVEIVSSNTVTSQLQTEPADINNQHQNISEDEAAPGFRFVPNISRKKKTKKPDRRGFSRYEAWDRAMDRYRSGGESVNASQPALLEPARGANPPASIRPDYSPVQFVGNNAGLAYPVTQTPKYEPLVSDYSENRSFLTDVSGKITPRIQFNFPTEPFSKEKNQIHSMKLQHLFLNPRNFHHLFLTELESPLR